MRDAIFRAAVYSAPRPATFHDAFSAKFVLWVAVAPLPADAGRFFEFDRYPLLDSNNPCRRSKDLNQLEIARILDSDEQEIYGTVLSPCSERRPITSQCEWDNYRRTAAHYRQDPDAWQPVYTRNFTDGRRRYLGHAVQPRTSTQRQPQKQLLLSPESI